MSYTGTVYSNVAGATTAVAGQTVQSAVWNNIHTDIGNALTQSYSQTVNMQDFRNIMYMNGSFDVWQRTNGGTSASIAVAQNTTAYTADRWYITTGATQASTISAILNTGVASQLACNIARNTGQTGATAMIFAYPLDSDECVRMHGRRVTFQASTFSGANWSPASGTLTVTLFAGTGAPTKAGAAGVNFAGLSTVFTTSVNIPVSTAVNLSVTSGAAVPFSTTQAELQFTWTPTGTAGAADTILFDECQLEVNGSPSTWAQTQYDRIPFEICINACKRHYQKTFTYSVAPAQGAGTPGSLTALAVATQRSGFYWSYPVEMRTTAAITTFNPSGASANWQDIVAAVSVAVVVETTNTASQHGIFIYTTTSGSTTNNWLMIQAQADAGI